jgi:hypothetical protein
MADLACCITTPLSVLFAALIFELLAMTLALSCTTAPWGLRGERAYFLLYYVDNGVKTSYDAADLPLGENGAIAGYLGKASISLFVFGFLCYLAVFGLGLARLLRLYDPQNSSRVLAALNAAPSFTFAVVGYLFLVVAAIFGFGSIYKSSGLESDIGPSAAGAVLNCVIALVAVLLDSSLCCCCCRRVALPLEDETRTLLATR